MVAVTSQMGAREAPATPLVPGVASRSAAVALALAALAAVALFVGARFALLLAIGLGFGITLEGLRFGFAGPWRALILRREAGGVLAQILAIALTALVAMPLIAANPGELSGAAAPIGWAMLGGAFVFGAAMQVVLGCGSGTLVNAGSGNPVAVVALPFFALGSFLGSFSLVWWTNLGSLPVVVLGGASGLGITLALLAVVAAVVLAVAAPGHRRIPGRWIAAAGLLAVLALANLIVSGQPWGVVYGLGLWGAKAAASLGVDLSASAFWSAPGNAARVTQSVLTDITSLTAFGTILGAMLVAFWRGGLAQRLPDLPARAWVATVVSGLLLGYSSRLAFGCNVGALFSGISTGSLHGWAWLVMGFAGSAVGVKLRPILGMEGRK